MYAVCVPSAASHRCTALAANSGSGDTRHPTHEEQLGQQLDDVHAPKPARDADGQALARERELVDDVSACGTGVRHGCGPLEEGVRVPSPGPGGECAFRYKSIIGDDLRARNPAAEGSEVVPGCEILNWMTDLARPVSYRIG